MMDADDKSLNEPKVAYTRNKLRVFTNFQDAEDYEKQQAALRTPYERIRDTVELILRVYGTSREDLKNRKKSRHIKIVRYK